jgi:hypothetical protein
VTLRVVCMRRMPSPIYRHRWDAMYRSKIPLHKWVLAMHLLPACEKGIPDDWASVTGSTTIRAFFGHDRRPAGERWDRGFRRLNKKPPSQIEQGLIMSQSVGETVPPQLYEAIRALLYATKRSQNCAQSILLGRTTLVANELLFDAFFSKRHALAEDLVRCPESID